MALDGLGEKLKSFFKPKEDPRFKGQGRRLGTSEGQSSGPKPKPTPVTDGGRAASRTSPSDANAAHADAPTPLKPPPQPLGQGGRPALALSRSHRTDDVVLDVAVMANTPTGKEAHLVSAHKPPSGGRTSSNLCPGSPPSHPASPPQRASPCSPTTTVTGGAGRGGAGGAVEGYPGLKVDVQRTSGGGGGGSGGGAGRRPPLAGPAGGRGRSSPWGPGSNVMNSMVSTISTPTAAEKRMGGFRCPAPPTDGAMADYGLAPATSQAYELQRCLALVLSSRPLSNSNLSTNSSYVPISGTVSSGALQPEPPRQVSAPDGLDVEAPPRAPFAAAAAAAGSAQPELETATTPHSLNPLANSTGSSTSLATATSTANATDCAGAAAAAAAARSGTAEAAASPAQPSGQATPSAFAVDALGDSAPSDGAGGAAATHAPGGGGTGSGVASPRECCDALLRVLRNVLTRPEEPKFRQIRLSNPKVQETIVNVPGAVEFLEAAGFKMHFAPDDGSETANQGFLVLPDEVAPTALAEAFRILSAVMAAHGFAAAAAAGAAPGAAAHGAAAAGSDSPRPPPHPVAPPAPASSRLAAGGGGAPAPQAPAVERFTQVLLPAAPDVEVPDWFFQRTGAEIREQWAAMVRKREEAERFMTRTMREVRRQQQAAEAEAAEAGSGGNPPGDVATVRVRFPEGVCLQGRFGATEPVSRVFQWVSDSLRSPTLTFELIRPDRRPLETTTTAAAAAAAARGKSGAAARPAAAAGGGAAVPLTVRMADMLPSVLLNLRPTGQEAAALTAANMPMLSDAMLRTTKPQ